MSQKPASGRFSHMLGLKALVIVVLAALLLIPLSMVRDVIFERSLRSRQVESEIADKWAGSQAVQGPFLIIPGERINPASEKGELQYRKTVLLPEAFAAQAEVTAEVRSRGIFDAIVYTTAVRLNGSFTAEMLERAGFEADGWRMRLDQAVLALGINDLRGLQGDLAAKWENDSIAAEAGMPGTVGLPLSGIHWPVVAGGIRENGTARFDVTFTLRGSSRLALVPVGKSSVIEMKGNWHAPSFDGRALPVDRLVDEAGFSARWDIFHLSRPLPQSWVAGPGVRESHLAEERWDDLTVGASFLQPVDFYRLSERSTKYGLLVVALLFLAYFLFEVLSGVALHPLQYLMVGAALVLFFLSLVAFSEVLGFAAAYALSGLLVVAMIGLYTGAILKRRRWASLLGVMVTVLYSLIYLILNLEEAALLAGTLVLFAALGLTMFVTRRVDWFNARRTETLPGAGAPGRGDPAPDAQTT